MNGSPHPEQSQRRFFFVFACALARDAEEPFTAAIYHDDPPSPAMLKQLSPVLYKAELLGRWHGMPLGEILDEYRRRHAAGTVPRSNMVPPPPADGRKERRLLTPRHEIEAMIARRRGAKK